MQRRRMLLPVALLACLFLLYALAVYIIDPYMHYHEPWFGMTPQRTDDSRFESYGQAKYMEYDAIMLGTSVTQDAKASEFNALFSRNALRVKFAGSYFKELGDFLKYAFDNHEEIKTVFWVLDITHILTAKDTVGHTDNPEYLYDKSFWNDSRYLLNKDVFPDMLRSLGDLSPVDFDWQVWSDPTGYETLLNVYGPNRPEKSEEKPFTDELAKQVLENYETNILSVARANPDTEFYLVFPPGNAFFWDYNARRGEYECYMAAMELVAGEMLKIPNVRVYSFVDDPEKTLDFDRFKDRVHFDPAIMSEIIADVAAGRRELKGDTLAARMAETRAFWQEYDYEALYVQTSATETEEDTK